MKRFLILFCLSGITSLPVWATPITWQYHTTVNQTYGNIGLPAGSSLDLNYTFDSSILGTQGTFDVLSGSAVLDGQTFNIGFNPGAITSFSGFYRVYLDQNISGTYGGNTANYFQFGVNPTGVVGSPSHVTGPEGYANLASFDPSGAAIVPVNYSSYTVTQLADAPEPGILSFWSSL